MSLFLLLLILMDSYKLLAPSSVVQALLMGWAAAFASLYVNSWVVEWTGMELDVLRHYVAPVIEEALKAVYVVYLVRANKVGFLVDAAVLGFAVGTGFSWVENVHYLRNLADANILLWVVRGLGTAVLHGSATAVFAILAKGLADRHRGSPWLQFVPGFLVAVLIHAVFNHVIPRAAVATTATLLLVVPILLVIVFDQSEKATRRWLGSGMDADLEVIELIRTGEIRDDNVGVYLQSLRTRFPGKVVADMLCYLQIHLELSVQAKGLLLARAAGIDVPIKEGVRANLEELDYLRKSIGRTGRLALAPFLNTSSRELWQLYMLSKK